MLDLLVALIIIWFTYRVLKVWAAVAILSKIPVDFIFPVKLEYTADQWFAWDNENEFLGQAKTKEELLERMSKELDFPKDKFTVLSEIPFVNHPKR